MDFVRARRMRDDNGASQFHLHIVGGQRHTVHTLIVLPIGCRSPVPPKELVQLTTLSTRRSSSGSKRKRRYRQA